MIVGAIRADDVNFPLLLHVAGAMLLVASLVLAAVLLTNAARRDAPGQAVALTRSGFRTLLLAVLPSFLVMRISAQMVYDEENIGQGGAEDPTWVGIGFITTDIGVLLLLAALVVSGLAVRRVRRAGPDASAVGSRAASVLTLILLVAYAVAVFAMTAKPD